MEYCRRYIVSGVVQGVGFRYHAQKRAESLELIGWVRNLADGNVEVLAYGRTDRLDELYGWLLHGPSAAVVSEVEVEDAELEEVPLSFSIR